MHPPIIFSPPESACRDYEEVNHVTPQPRLKSAASSCQRKGTSAADLIKHRDIKPSGVTDLGVSF